MSELMKLQKYMSQAWICSRRKAEKYIEEGLVKVNGEVAHIGQKVNPEVDKIEMLDKIVEDQKKLVYYKVNKPRGIVTTCAEFWDKNIIDIVDIPERVFSKLTHLGNPCSSDGTFTFNKCFVKCGCSFTAFGCHTPYSTIIFYKFSYHLSR